MSFVCLTCVCFCVLGTSCVLTNPVVDNKFSTLSITSPQKDLASFTDRPHETGVDLTKDILDVASVFTKPRTSNLEDIIFRITRLKRSPCLIDDPNLTSGSCHNWGIPEILPPPRSKTTC